MVPFQGGEALILFRSFESFKESGSVDRQAPQGCYRHQSGLKIQEVKLVENSFVLK